MLEQLKEKFGDCKCAPAKNCSGAYELVMPKKFFIFDPSSEDNSTVRIVSEDENHQLTVQNEKEHTICLVKTDNCLFTSSISKCDCILFDKSNFYLVEIKSSGLKTRGQQRTKAAEQLGATIEHLRNKGVSFSAYGKDCIRAIICFKSQSTYPIKASLNSHRAIFLEKYEVSLEEGNQIDF